MDFHFSSSSREATKNIIIYCDASNYFTFFSDDNCLRVLGKCFPAAISRKVFLGTDGYRQSCS